MNSLREPDAGNPPVRFDEGEMRTRSGCGRKPSSSPYSIKLHRDAQFKCVNHDFGRGAAFERVERIPYSYADERHSQETIGDLQ